ncbi:MAG: TonB-dependent receptor [Acidobacteria bacterium]|nr:TonB-dependent receptor [Acidobacteriota bacterium]
MLLTLSGSLSNVQQSFRTNSPTATEFLDMLQVEQPPGRTTVQNEWNAFFKDDWKVTPSLTLNLGLRYEYYAVPYEANGLTAALAGGGMSAFGWSGRGWNDYWAFGPQKGDLTVVEFIGPNSPNPGKQLYKDDWNNFGPAAGFSWSLPWLGKDKTTIRGGYGVSYIGQGGRGSAIDSSIGQGPGTLDQQTFTSSQYLDLSRVTLPLQRNRPGRTIPITERTQSIDGWDPNLVNPYIQSFNLSLTRTLRQNIALDLRYVGTKGTKLYGSVPINQSNYLTNGLLEALNITRAGGDAPLFDQLLRGLVINTGQAPVGSGGVTRSAALRQSNTFRGNIANGNYTAVANSLNASTLVNGLGGGLIRNGGFPENFIVNNPQFNNATL